MKSTPSSQAQRGAALIITLFFVVIITVVVVGFLDSVRVDRVASNSHFERMRASTLAQSGVEATVATLQRETIDLGRNWVSQPGALTVPTANTNDKYELKKTVPLSSGKSSAEASSDTSLDPILRAPNLNVQLLVDQNPASYLLSDQIDPNTNSPLAMSPRWIYVRQDGSLDLDSDGTAIESPDLSNRANPIVGRYAYWADDESSKVNYNLAWNRDPSINTNPPGHQTKVDLRGLPGFNADIANSLHKFVTADNYSSINRFFHSPFDARQVTDGAVRTAVSQNKFSLTHYNSDPDTTYYGKSRMMLTTQLSNAVIRDAKGDMVIDDGKPLVRPYLDIIQRPSETSTTFVDPGRLANVSISKLNIVVKELVNNYLKRSDWPIVDGIGHSIQEKYYTAYTGTAREERLAQIALNIIDYVRSAESKLTVVEPIRGKFVSGDFVGDWAPGVNIRGQEDTYKGLTRAPLITEMGLWVAKNPESAGVNKDRYRTVGFIEVHLPLNYGIDELNLLNTDGKTWSLYWKEVTGQAGGLTYDHRGNALVSTEPKVGYRLNRNLVAGDAPMPAFVVEATGNKNGAIMKAGEYRTIAIEYWRTKPRSAGAVIRAAITITGTSSRIDVVPLGDNLPVKQIAYSLDADTVGEDQIHSVETADPRVNGVAGAWQEVPKNTFGRVNSRYTAMVGSKPDSSILPEQDLDLNGNVTAASVRMPYPFNPAKELNKTGRVRSAAELGLIHTGIEGSSIAPSPGVNFRTLHLQPSRQLTTVVPDWAFMDLFTVPVDVPVQASVIFAPHSSSTGGRVNINARPEPFDIQRTDPLVAVLFGARKNSVTNATLTMAEAKTLAKNIYDRTLVPVNPTLPSGKNYPAASTGIPKVYESPGEVVEISGVADKGEESEELLREIGNLITARGNVFSVYTIGQALRQTPNGKLLVTAEHRQQAMVERYLVSKGTTTQADDEARVRTVYIRDLTP